MSKQNVNTGLILAAGFGKRMLPLTKDMPKPLIEVQNKPLIWHCIFSLKKAGIKNIIINVHYKSQQIVDYVKKLDSSIIISDESKKILDTGGAIKKAFRLTNSKTILVMNSDVFWDQYTSKSLKGLINKFDAKIMDSFLMTTKIKNTFGYSGNGDFIKNKKNQIERFDNNKAKVPLVYCGVQIVKRNQFDNYDSNVFSTNKIWDNNIKHKKLYTFMTNKKFNHVGTIESVIGLNK